MGFPGGSEVKASASNAGDPGSIPGSGRSPGEGNGNPLQYYCLKNRMDGGTWWATVHGFSIPNSCSSVSCSVISNSLRPHGLYVARQSPVSMGFSRQEYWSGLPFPPPGDLPNIRLPLFPNQRTEPEQDFTSLPLAKEMSASHRDVCCCC